MNFLTEHKIEQYADLVSRIEEMSAESGQAADALKNAEKRLADMAVLIKNVSTYQKTKPVYDAYRKDVYKRQPHGNFTPAWFSCSPTHCLRRS